MVTLEQAQQQLNIKKVIYGSLSWLDVEMPTLAEMEYLKQTYDFHPLALDDCLSRIQLPKVDDYDDYLFLVLHFPLFNREARLTVASQVSVFVGSDYVITVHKGDLRPLMKLFGDCEASEAVRKGVMGQSSGYLLYRILDGLVDDCFPMLNKVEDEVDNLEIRVFDVAAKELARNLSIARRDILAYRRIVRPQIGALELLENEDYPFLKVDPDVYFGDLADHMRRISVELEDLKEVVEGLHDTYVSLSNIRIAEVIRILTVIFTFTLPATTLGTLYGMNVGLPLETKPYAFGVLLGVMAVGTIAAVFFLRARRWL